MSEFFKIDPLSSIGFKKLSNADSGLSATSNQTHIGLYEDTLSFIPAIHKTSTAKLLYDNKSYELICLLDYIENPDGTFRSPKIRNGDNNELKIGDLTINSIVRQIRDIIFKTSTIDSWYLMWFGFINKELGFLLFRKKSLVYTEILKLIPNPETGGRILNIDSNFGAVKKYLEKKVDLNSNDFLEKLEIIAQTDEIPADLIKPRKFDIEKAKKRYHDTGRKGEEFVALYLEGLKTGRAISNFHWLNKSSESGFPYDFEIKALTGNTIYMDVKTTSYKFDQKIVFSNQELRYINQPIDYHLYRVYDFNLGKPVMRICESLNLFAKNANIKIGSFQKRLTANDIKLNSLKLEVSPLNPLITFQTNIIELN